MKNANELFNRYNCTDNYYKYSMPGYLLTDGVKAMADKCECYWFIDIILSYQLVQKVKVEEFQSWKLKRVNDCQFVIIADSGCDNVIARQEIHFSDFTFDVATIWLVNGILLLPSEY